MDYRTMPKLGRAIINFLYTVVVIALGTFIGIAGAVVCLALL